MKDKCRNTVWVTENEPQLEVLMTGFCSRKGMFTISVHSQGLVYVDIMPDKEKIPADYHPTTVLPEALEHTQSTVLTNPTKVSNPPAPWQCGSSHCLTQAYLDDNVIHFMGPSTLFT